MSSTVTVSAPKVEELAATQKEPSKITLRLQKRDGEIFLDFQIDKSLENLFKEKSEEIKDSEKWQGLTFYSIPSLLDSIAYQQLLERHRLFDNYGQEIMKRGFFNVAFMRTVGGKGSVRLNEEIPFAEASEAMKRIIAFMKQYYTDFVSNYEVRGSISVEL